MFGYVVPDKMNMFMKDYYGYRAFYCGLCKSIGKRCSQLMRINVYLYTSYIGQCRHNFRASAPCAQAQSVAVYARILWG